MAPANGMIMMMKAFGIDPEQIIKDFGSVKEDIITFKTDISSRVGGIEETLRRIEQRMANIETNLLTSLTPIESEYKPAGADGLHTMNWQRPPQEEI